MVEINKYVSKTDEESAPYFWTDLMRDQDAEEPTLVSSGFLTAADLPNFDPKCMAVRSTQDIPAIYNL